MRSHLDETIFSHVSVGSGMEARSWDRISDEISRKDMCFYLTSDVLEGGMILPYIKSLRDNSQIIVANLFQRFDGSEFSDYSAMICND